MDLARANLAYPFGGPLRGLIHREEGMRNLSKAHAKEPIAVELALCTAEVCTLASRRGFLWSLENTASSGLWEFGPVVDLMGLPEVFKVTFHMCQYGVLHKKPTTVLTNVLALRGLEAKCSGGHVHRVLEGQERVLGADGVWRSQCKTKAVGAFPSSL